MGKTISSTDVFVGFTISPAIKVFTAFRGSFDRASADPCRQRARCRLENTMTRTSLTAQIKLIFPLAARRGGASATRASRTGAVTAQPPPVASVAHSHGLSSAPTRPLTSNISRRGQGSSLGGGTYHRRDPDPGSATHAPPTDSPADDYAPPPATEHSIPELTSQATIQSPAQSGTLPVAPATLENCQEEVFGAAPNQGDDGGDADADADSTAAGRNGRKPQMVSPIQLLSMGLHDFFKRPGMVSAVESWRTRTPVEGELNCIQDGGVWKEIKGAGGDSFFFGPGSEEEIRLGVSFSSDWYVPIVILF
ncbi:hypothetical protein C8R44DRAFT_731992 [Mycena epipterygia]|nr:hypothetical protein C8R44DRAFT_731992 [Mycena epipterygia]